MQLPTVIRAPFIRVERDSSGKLHVDGLVQAAAGLLASINENPADAPFVRWDWDGTRLRITNDPLGFRPLYYAATESMIVASPSLIRVLEQAAPGEVDYNALGVFLRLGFFIGGDTPFRAVRALQPNVELTWRPTIGIAIHNRGLVRPPTSSISRQAAVNRYVDVFRAAMERRLPEQEDFVFPLSGGRDSRHILFELCSLGHPPKLCMTAKRDPTQTSALPDVHIAPQVAERLGLSHTLFKNTVSSFENEIRTNVKLDLCVDEHAWISELYSYINSKNNIAYDGIGGDVLSANSNVSEALLSLLANEEYELAAMDVFRRWGKVDSIREYLSEDLARKMPLEQAVAHLATELKSHADSANPGVSFYFWNRTRREIALAPFSLLDAVRKVHCPFLDLEVAEFLLSLPAELTLDGGFHTATIHQAFPQYSDLPFEPKRPSTVRNFSVYISRLRYLADFICFVAARRRDWVSRFDAMLARAWASHLSLDYVRAARFLPTALYLLQLQAFTETDTKSTASTFGCTLTHAIL